MNIKSHLSILGKPVKDKVTGMKGIVSSVSFDLYGCIQVIVNPGLGKDGKPQDQLWFDIGRMEILSQTPVMKQPDYDFGPISEGKKGAAEKPSFMKC